MVLGEASEAVCEAGREEKKPKKERKKECVVRSSTPPPSSTASGVDQFATYEERKGVGGGGGCESDYTASVDKRVKNSHCNGLVGCRLLSPLTL